MNKRRRSRIYTEGDWFAVPLRSGGYGVGIVAREGYSGILLGYFFGPQRLELPVLEELSHLQPDAAVLICEFGDLSLRKRQWPVLGHHKQWDRRDWPIPVFGHIDVVDSTKAFKRWYGDDDLLPLPREFPATPEEVAHLPIDGLYGTGALEAELTHVLGKQVIHGSVSVG